VKYGILNDYLPALSTIVGKRGWPHWFIDACAGSGKVQIDNDLVDGSPLIMAKVREKVQRPSLRCIFIERHEKTYDSLIEAIRPYSEFSECIHGDCNEKLFEKLGEIPDRHFAFIFLDPFGLGDPIIKRETVTKLMERPSTEILMTLSWKGISQVGGYAFKRYDFDERARAMAETLDTFFGGREGWWGIESSYYPHPYQKRRVYLELYKQELQRHYDYVEDIEVPPGSSNPVYYLIFTTRHPKGQEIIQYTLAKWRRWRPGGHQQLTLPGIEV